MADFCASLIYDSLFYQFDLIKTNMILRTPLYVEASKAKGMLSRYAVYRDMSTDFYGRGGFRRGYRASILW